MAHISYCRGVTVALGVAAMLLLSCSTSDDLGNRDRPIVGGLLGGAPSDGCLVANGRTCAVGQAGYCSASAIRVAGADAGTNRFILTAAHCFAELTDPANMEFEFSNLPGRPRVRLYSIWRSSTATQPTPGNLANFGDFAVATFESGCHTLPDSAFGAVTTKAVSAGDALVLHGIRKQETDGAPAPGDKNGCIFEASFCVSSVDGLLANVSTNAIIARDSGGRGSRDGVAYTVNSLYNSGWAGLSVVTLPNVVSLLNNTFVGAVDGATLGVTNPFTAATRLQPTDCTDGGVSTGALAACVSPATSSSTDASSSTDTSGSTDASSTAETSSDTATGTDFSVLGIDATLVNASVPGPSDDPPASAREAESRTGGCVAGSRVGSGAAGTGLLLTALACLRRRRAHS